MSQCSKFVGSQRTTVNWIWISGLLRYCKRKSLLLGSKHKFRWVILQQKREENDFAIRLLPDRLTMLSLLPDDQRHMQVIKGLLAGNVFDWGAKEVVQLMESTGLSFEQAEAKLQSDRSNQLSNSWTWYHSYSERPWLIDGLDQWRERLESGNPHNCAAIFVDNSGADLILGVIPFALDLLRNGTKVSCWQYTLSNNF